MIHFGHREPLAKLHDRAFTLIEIVVALTILAVIAAVAIPTLAGLQQEEKARAPVQTLAEVVQEVRQRAMRERRAYQIVFEREGIHASPAMYPYDNRDEFLKQLEEMRTPPIMEPTERLNAQRVEVQREVIDGRTAQDPAAPPAEEAPLFEMPWTTTIPLQAETECEVLLWGDGEWDVIEGEKMRRWVFQPTGMASPMRVRLRTGAAKLEATFDLLTGELTAERIRPHPPQL
jgi:prepilin-type N-terminal cleavage/methylation domain-containing protein